MQNDTETLILSQLWDTPTFGVTRLGNSTASGLARS